MAIGPALPETPLVLDNDVFTHWRNSQSYILREINGHYNRLKSLPALTSMTIFEALYGVELEERKNRIAKVQAQQYKDRIKELSEACGVLPWEQNAAAITAHIFPRLAGQQLPKHWKDLFIAATAIAHGYGVATRNRKDFELIASYTPNDVTLRVAVW
jgi:predicted nucleic acid-binding protein